jgi:hypothetical protein
MLGRGQYLSPVGMVNLSLPMSETDFDGLSAAFDDFLQVHDALLAEE